MTTLQYFRYSIDIPSWLASPGPSGSLEFVWLGQAGFLYKTESLLVGIDPYLSNSLGEKYREAFFPHTRMMEVPCDPELLQNVDYLFSTHGHTDHMDPGTLGVVYDTDSSTPLFICPRAEIQKAADRGVPYDRIVTMDAGESWSSSDAGCSRLSVTAIASAHEELKVDSHGNHLFLGYVIDMAGIRVFHSGDGVPYEGLDKLLANLAIDVAFLPVNGRDAFRSEHGVPGNFTLDEAFHLVDKASIPCLVPHHFGLFEFNTIDPETIHGNIPENGPIVLIPEVSVAFSITKGGDA